MNQCSMCAGLSCDQAVVHVANNSTVLSIFAILGHVFTTRSGVMAWERDQQLAFLVVMMLPTLMPFLDSKYYILNANE